MLRRNLLVVLIAAAEWIGSAGCSGEAAPSPRSAQAQANSSAALPASEHRPSLQNGIHIHARRGDVPRPSFASTYNNPEEGVSFRYPRNYSLEEGEIEEHSFFLQRQQDLDIEQPGTKLLVTVLIPEDGYPNTTFEHGSLQLVVKEAETDAGCQQTGSAEAGGSDFRALTEQGVVLHGSGAETEVAGTRILQRKYAGFSHGSCYHFQLTVAAQDSADPDGFTKAADIVRIMKQLETIVASSHFFTKSPPPAEMSGAANRL